MLNKTVKSPILYIGVLVLFGSGFYFLLHQKTAKKEYKKQPNIILILSDDLTWSDSEPYGNTEVNTPNIERLAGEGMTFYGMHTTTAMCSPTRQELYSGMYPVRNGAYPNHSWSYEGVKSIPQYLRPLGYRVGIAGKHDFGPPESYPFTNVGKPGSVDKKTLNSIDEFITQDQPFALVVASHQPHKPWNKGDVKAYDPDKLIIPATLEDTPETRKQLAEYYAEITYMAHQLGEVLDMLEKSGKKDNTLVLFTSEQGAQFPFAKWTCYEDGLKTAFIARWPGNIQSGSQNHALTQYVDVVPTLIDVAGGNPDTVHTGRPDALGNTGLDGKSFLSLMLDGGNHFRDYVYGAHTTLGIIGGDKPYPIRSVSDGRYKLIRNLNASVEFSNITKTRATALIDSWKKAGKDNPNIAYRTAYYYKRPPVEFYDLKKDPNELHNLAGDPKYNDKIKALDKKLDSWMRQQGDEGLATEKEAHSRSWRVISKKNKAASLM